MISYLGFEWSQVGATPETHYGHKNVIFEGLEDKELAMRPIASGGLATEVLAISPNMARSTVFLDLEIVRSITTLENISQRLVKHHHAIRHYLQMNCQMVL